MDIAEATELESDRLILEQQRLDHKLMHWLRRPSVWLVCVIVLMVALALGLGELSRQVITYKLACNGLSYRAAVDGVEPQCDPKQAQLLVSNLQMMYTMCLGIAGTFAVLKIGPLSDVYGRRIFLIIIIVLFALGRTLKFLVLYHFASLNVTLMIILELITDSGGGLIGLITVVNCYISDVVLPDERIFSLGILMALMLMGVSIGPLIGNFILKLAQKSGTQFVPTGSVDDVLNSLRELHMFAPLKFELALYYFTIAYVVWWLTELRLKQNRERLRSYGSYGLLLRSSLFCLLTLTPEENEAAIAEEPTIKEHLNIFSLVKILWIPAGYRPSLTLKRDRVTVLLLVIQEMIMTSIIVSIGEVFVLYGIYSYQWSSIDIGHMLAALCSSKAVVLVVILPLLTQKVFPKLGLRASKSRYDSIDFILAFGGVFTDALSVFLLIKARNTTEFISALVFGALSGWVLPTQMLAIIKYYPELKVGEVFGGLSVMKNMMTLLGPLLYLSVYKYAVNNDTPSLVFVVYGVIMLMVSSLLVVVRVINF